ncbi:NAD-dependent epimerase/dehydratase family protein [Acanthopleuribacter pedis]|uniref:SDR family oxidoreductase n=1 Tax=Acanthopleuribacter pedis TaxID=442870 RepID=A0A8J7Q2G6_9BACT|nr:SDR family oxidoreductase [Acanthopleuribacter pedis]MBO1317037.1 SDR family oxidoreductase [Acanthopleuribacter pedis]
MSREKILVTGGAGYVGAVLVPKLINAGYDVVVFDLMLYGADVLQSCDPAHLDTVKGDIRDQAALKAAMVGVNQVIHLACISNDPSFELDPELGRSINRDAFRPLVEIARDAGVHRFIYASSSSVYGIKSTPNVTEDMPCEPLTDYSRFKAECETILAEYQSDSFTTVTIRPATVCGYSPRQRLDVIVNILTNHAYHNRQIKVFGGDQLRPNIHIADMTDLYIKLLREDKTRVAGKIYNAGYENHPVREIAQMVKAAIGEDVGIVTTPTDDNRSYHVSSQKIARELGFVATHTIEEAVADLKKAFDDGLLPNSFEDARYFNIKTMQAVDLH